MTVIGVFTGMILLAILGFIVMLAISETYKIAGRYIGLGVAVLLALFVLGMLVEPYATRNLAMNSIVIVRDLLFAVRDMVLGLFRW